MSTLRQATLHLAQQVPELRKHLVPLLRQARTYQDYVDDKKKDGEKPLSKDEWEARTQGGDDKKDERGAKPSSKSKSFPGADQDDDYGLDEEGVKGLQHLMEEFFSSGSVQSEIKKVKAQNADVQKLTSTIKTFRRRWVETVRDMSSGITDQDVESARRREGDEAADAVKRLQGAKSLEDVDPADLKKALEGAPTLKYELESVGKAHDEATDLHKRREEAHKKLTRTTDSIKSYIRSKE